MSRLIRFVLAVVFTVALVAPASAAYAVNDDAALPVPDAELLESTPVTVKNGQIGASVSPASLIFTDVDTRGGVVRIGNPSETLLRISVKARDYTVDATGKVALDENGEPTVGTPNYAYASADWYTFQYTEFLLPAGRIVNLPFSLDVPGAAAPGDHTAALVVVARRADVAGLNPPDGQSGAAYLSQYRFLVRLQHRVAGAESKMPGVKVSAVVDGSQRIDFIATVDNLGTTVLDYTPYRESDPKPFFRIRAKDTGEIIREFQLVKGFYVLPEANRIITVSWRDENLEEPAGSDAEIARLKADEQNTEDREQLALVRAKLKLAEARKAIADAPQITAEVGRALQSFIEAFDTWYAAERTALGQELPPAAIDAKVTSLINAIAMEAKVAVPEFAPIAKLAGIERAATAELRLLADLNELPYTGDYVVEFVLPKRGDLEGITVKSEFSFVNPFGRERPQASPLLLVAVAAGAGAIGLGILVYVVRRRRSDEVEAE